MVARTVTPYRLTVLILLFKYPCVCVCLWINIYVIWKPPKPFHHQNSVHIPWFHYIRVSLRWEPCVRAHWHTALWQRPLISTVIKYIFTPRQIATPFASRSVNTLTPPIQSRKSIGVSNSQHPSLSLSLSLTHREKVCCIISHNYTTGGEAICINIRTFKPPPEQWSDVKLGSISHLFLTAYSHFHGIALVRHWDTKTEIRCWCYFRLSLCGSPLWPIRDYPIFYFSFNCSIYAS